MTLREFVERADAKACEIFAKEGRILPLYHIVAGDDCDVIVPSPRTEGKDMEAMMMRALLAIFEAKRFVCIDEMWMLELHAKSEEEAKALHERTKKEGIRDMPGRIEAISFVAEDQNEPAIMAYRQIIRPEKGKPTLGPLKVMSPDGAGGRFVGMLPQKGRMQ